MVDYASLALAGYDITNAILTYYSRQERSWMPAPVCSLTSLRLQGVIGRSESLPSMSPPSSCLWVPQSQLTQLFNTVHRQHHTRSSRSSRYTGHRSNYWSPRPGFCKRRRSCDCTSPHSCRVQQAGLRADQQPYLRILWRWLCDGGHC